MKGERHKHGISCGPPLDPDSNEDGAAARGVGVVLESMLIFKERKKIPQAARRLNPQYPQQESIPAAVAVASLRYAVLLCSLFICTTELWALWVIIYSI
jgi:hypothetical protein